MALPIPPESDIPVLHPPNDDRGIGSARRFPPPRPLVRSIGLRPTGPSVPTEHPYVRRYWAAILGTAALEDLLRLAAAAHKQVRVRRPTHLHVLIAEGLVRPVAPDTVEAPVRMPILRPDQVRRLPLPLRATHPRPPAATADGYRSAR